MREGMLTWTELEQVLDQMGTGEAGLSPRERQFAEGAILAGSRRIGQEDVQGYAGVADEPAPLTEGEFRALAEKLRVAADRLPAAQRAMARDAFLQGVVPASDGDEVQGYFCASGAHFDTVTLMARKAGEDPGPGDGG